ncbi:MAG: hypothetical protein FJW86_12670 [Actinobacteria bacterium]|nr:hypothetical protein [Actinomycetota bacterium]
MAGIVSADALKARFGWRAERRPEPGFGHVLAAAAGSFLVFSAFALVNELADPGDRQLPGIIFSLALLAVGVIGGMQFTGPLRSAFATVIVLATPLLWIYVFLVEGDGGRGDLRAVYLLTIASYAVFASVVWTRGRGIMIGLFLVVFTAWVLFEVGGDTGGSVPFSDQINTLQAPGPVDLSAFGSGDTTTDVSIASLILGLVYLAAAFRFDRQKLTGLATPFIAVGAFFGIIGAITLGTEGESQMAAGWSAAGIGLVVGVIGGLGLHRRGTTWIGVLFIKGGLVVVAEDISNDPLALAGIFLVFAIGLAVIALVSAQKFGEYVDGDEQGGTVASPRPISI